MSEQLPAYVSEAFALDESPKGKIAALAGAMRALPPEMLVEPPLDHFFAQGLYGRMIHCRAGETVVTKVHLQEHITAVLKGVCLVFDESGQSTRVEAPTVFVTPPGRQRAVHVVEDCIWLTVHATEAKTVEEAESVLVVDDMPAYELKMLEKQT